MNLLDGCILGVIVISTLAALGRGLFIEVCSLAGLLLGLVLASHGYTAVARVLIKLLHLQPELNDMAAFLLIVVVVLLLATWLGHALHKVATYSGLGWLDALLGALFGFARGFLAVTVTMMALAAFIPTSTWTASSRLAPYFLDAAGRAAVVVPGPLQERIEQGVWTLKQISTLRLWK